MIFNEEQLRAVKHGEGPALILAGPGSGKTAVITERTLRLVRQKKTEPGRVLVITFSRAAAEEMRRRYLEKTAALEGGVCFGTFHAVFFRILYRSGAVNKNAILTPAEGFEIAGRIYSGIRGVSRFDPEDVEALLNETGRMKNGRTAAFGRLPCSREEFELFASEYRAALKERGKLDFDDILAETLRLLEADLSVRQHWQQAFDYILVDEYQDINPVQYETLKLLAAPKNNLFVVGDEDQSIYAFRGADPSLTQRFLEEFPDAETVVLSKNYRSGLAVTKAAQSLIKHNSSRLSKRMVSAAKNRGRVQKLCFEDRHGEYEALAELLKKDAKGTSAVLYRTNGEAALLMKALEDKGIRYSIKDKSRDLFSDFLAQDLLAYARIADGSLDRADFLRICNKPERLIKRSFFDEERVDTEAVRKKAAYLGTDIDGFLEVIRAISGQPPFGVIMYIRHAGGYDGYIRREAKRRGTDPDEYFEILETLLETARNTRNADEWAKKLKKTQTGAGEEEDGRVRLMTFHASKGLEFDNVYITDLNEGISPHKGSEEGPALEEERRALYVALTRARNELVLMYVKKRGGRSVQPSRFLHEIL